MSVATRLERARTLAAADACRATAGSERQVAARLGRARSTLQRWERAGPVPADAPAELVAFVARPAGVQWLHRVVLAAQFVITLRAGAGVRLVGEFLELSGLSAFVGASYGSQQALNAALEQAVVEVAGEQRAALAEGMAPREVTVCEDETFHPAICLVALEPVSNFILLERYAKDRTADTWTQALAAACEGLAITIVQGTGDEAKALRRHIEHDNRAHHSPDLFHLQHEAGKATGLPLARAVAQAESRASSAETRWKEACASEQAYRERAHGPGRPPDFAKRIRAAACTLAEATIECEQARARRQEARESIAAFGELYHPYDIRDGQVQPVALAAARFDSLWQHIAALADAADLPARAREHLDKAKRLTGALLATLAFFFATVSRRIEALDLPPVIEDAVLSQLIPALYLERVAARSSSAAERHRLGDLSAQLLEPLRQPAHPIQALDADTRATVEQVAGDCADVFQRSSSAVEGRNGQLSLYHHGRHRLSDRKLAALTAVHNFHIRRPDGTTAAERLFGRTHSSLFEQLVERVPLPPLPRRRRPAQPRPPHLIPKAA